MAISKSNKSSPSPGSLSRAEIIEHYCHELKFDKHTAAHLLESILDAFIQTLKDQGSLKIPRFGSFQVHHKKARPGLNPRTLEKVTVSSRKVVRFKTSDIFQKRLNHEI
jgi:nucleoid DNA-binding protein